MPSGCLNNFTCSVKTDNAGTSTSTQFTMPTVSGGTYNCIVSWGDGNSSTITTYNDAAWTHTYSIAGTYTIIVSGIFNGLQFSAGGDCLKLLNISRWGNFKPTSVTGVFRGCANLTVTAKDILDLSLTTTLNQFFAACSSLTTVPSFNLWNHTSISNYGNCFGLGCVLFNMPINIRITSMTTTGAMLDGATNFNSPVTIDAVLNTGYQQMFRNTKMNSAINLNGTTVIRADSMLSGCTTYNQPLNNIGSLSVCTRVDSMLNGCTAFDQDISFFIIASLTNAASMLSASGFSITNYDKLLDITTGWPSQVTIQNNVVFSAGSAHYSAGAPTTGRNYLTSTKGWTITDGGSP